MKRFIQGDNRYQSLLFPETLDEYICEDNPVRVIDVFVEELDLARLGFELIPADTGRPAYHPAIMLKLYIYGYLNRIQSSRRLEKETQRNVEMMWLTEKLMPDHKTIANFRKDNGASIRKASSQFIVLCRQLNLFTQSIVAIDGSKFHGVNSRSRNFTRAKLKKRMERIEKSLKQYFAELDFADQEDLKIHTIDTDRVKDKIASLKKRMTELKALEEKVQELPDKQISLTDPEARSMRSNSETAGVIGYNVQSAVDTEHHLIVAHEVNNIGIDRAQLFNMAMKAKVVLNVEDLTALSDRGYYSGEQLLACEQAGIVTYVPKTNTSGARADGRFDRSDFRYIHEADQYECPAGKRLSKRTTTYAHGKKMYRYWRKDCLQCHLKQQCTPGKERRVTRWEHEYVIEAAEARLQKAPEMMAIRKSTVEHPFGTIKSWMGSTHFLMKTLPRVNTEMSLHVPAYNLRRMLKERNK
jgi:transposase